MKLAARSFTVILTAALLTQSALAVDHTTEANHNSLAGTWQFETDPQDQGKAQGWFNRPLTGTIRLPGSMAENNLGNPIKEIRQLTWGDSWTNVPVWHPMVKRDYRGAAWYQTTLHIPQNGSERFFELFLERVCWQSEAWIDGRARAPAIRSAPPISMTSGRFRRASKGAAIAATPASDDLSSVRRVNCCMR